jgi:hypothetical protein
LAAKIFAERGHLDEKDFEVSSQSSNLMTEQDQAAESWQIKPLEISASCSSVGETDRHHCPGISHSNPQADAISHLYYSSAFIPKVGGTDLVVKRLNYEK